MSSASRQTSAMTEYDPRRSGAPFPPSDPSAAQAWAPPPRGSYPPPQAGRPAKVRPRLLWVWLAWLFAIVCGVAGIVGFAGGIFSTLNDAAPAKSFGSGTAQSVSLDPKDKPAIWAAADQPSNVQCEVRGGSDQKITLTQPAGSQTLTIGSTKWELLFKIGVPAAGTYQVTCQAEDASSVRFGVGKELTASANGLVGGVVVLFVVPLAGFAVALTTTIVVLVRRGRNRRQAATGWGPGHPAAG